MMKPQFLRASPRSFSICRNCRERLRQRDTSLLQPISQTQTRAISQTHIEKIKRAEQEWQYRAHAIKSGKSPSMLERLDERGYINQVVGNRQDLDQLLTARRIGVYAGIDPTAPSMHVGHLVPFMALAFFYVHGYSVNYLLGGFTASIGDPTGRLTGRQQQMPSVRKANIASLHNQLKRFSASMERYAQRRGYQREWAWRRNLANNTSWWTTTSAKDFIGLMGTKTRLGPMLGRDTVKMRLESDGMSFAEFCYPLVQAWDWWHLFKTGVQLQIGGSDQFGNILAGADSIKTLAKDDHEHQVQMRDNSVLESKNGMTASNDPFGFTVPLLTTSSGEKFGKSAGNAVWLDASMTSPFELYQFFLRSADADVEKYLRLLTLVPIPDIKSLMVEHQRDASKRVPHHKLAKELVELIHGLGAANQAESEHRGLYGKALSVADLTSKSGSETQPGKSPGSEDAFINPILNKHAKQWDLANTGHTRLMLPRSLVIAQPLSRIAWSAGLVSSRAEGQRLITAGGLYIGADADAKGGMDDALNFTPAKSASWKDFARYVIDEKLLILRVGKWRLKIIDIVPDDKYTHSGETCPGWSQHLESVQASSKVTGIEHKEDAPEEQLASRSSP